VEIDFNHHFRLDPDGLSRPAFFRRGGPEELQRRMAEFADQLQGQQRLAWADNAIKLAVDMTVAAINRVNIQGTTEQQAQQIRTVMATVFPEAVTLVREARQGLS
jgi:hypothetical protein